MSRSVTKNRTIVRTVAAFPDLLELHRLDPERYPCLLESVEGQGGAQDRFDILFAFPQGDLVLWNDRSLDYQGPLDMGPSSGRAGFLDALAQWFEYQRLSPSVADGLPFHGGWFLYLAYELSAEIEPCLSAQLHHSGAGPLALARRFPAAVIRDRRTQNCHLVAEPDTAGTLLDAMEDDLGCLAAAARVPSRIAVVEEAPGQDFIEAVARALDYIRDGDVFQVNLSRPWTARINEPGRDSDVALYERLRTSNPGPFAGLARLAADHVVLSSSPERLVALRHGRVSTRPIAGTRPRAETVEADRRLARRLMAHPKERAEHIMLIDLERNDLGRVCRPGTVVVDELMVLESYRHVHHIVSNVAGELRDGLGPVDVIRAVFPGGTITGCPKVRCMEIIAELEDRPRGAYTGSMGYLDRDGSLDLNILIRTLERRGDCLDLRAGAGIVADSVPTRELGETRDKARGLLQALNCEDPVSALRSLG